MSECDFAKGAPRPTGGPLNLITHFPQGSALAVNPSPTDFVMKPIQFVLTLIVAAKLVTTSTAGYDWHPEANVEAPDDDKAVVHPQHALRRAQATLDLTSSGSGSLDDTTDATLATETELPTTIMVLLPDNLAPSYSGSGSVMFFDGAIGDKDKSESKSASSDTTGDEASSAASVEMMTMLTAFTMVLAVAAL